MHVQMSATKKRAFQFFWGTVQLVSRKSLNPVFTDMASDGGSLPAANCQDHQPEGPEAQTFMHPQEV